MGMTSTGSGQTVEQTQVQDQMNRLSSACEELDKTTAALENRLASVLRPPTPNVMQDEKAPQLVDLATRLSERVANIKAIIDKLSDIRQRTEL